MNVQAPQAVEVGSPVAAAPAQAGALTYQAFRIASLWCYTGFDEASELVEPLAASWLPNTPPWFKGLAHLNGYVVPVVDWVADPQQAGLAEDRAEHKPLFHLLFGRQQQRIAIAIHTLPFTVTAPTQAQSLSQADMQALPAVFTQLVDAVLSWDQISHTAQGSLALAAGGQHPRMLHHLSGKLLADWFSASLLV